MTTTATKTIQRSGNAKFCRAKGPADRRRDEQAQFEADTRKLLQAGAERLQRVEGF